MENANKNGNMKQNEDQNMKRGGNGIRGRVGEWNSHDDGLNG